MYLFCGRHLLLSSVLGRRLLTRFQKHDISTSSRGRRPFLLLLKSSSAVTSLGLISLAPQLDAVDPQKAPLTDEAEGAAYDDRSQLDWRQRFWLMWRKDEYDNLTPEISQISSTTTIAATFGFVIGGYGQSRAAFQKFVRENKHEMFETPRVAQTKMTEKTTLAFLRGGIYWGWRIGLLSCFFSMISVTMAAVRNYINPLDHALAGAVIGAGYMLMEGPRGMLVGAAIAGALGLAGGSFVWLTQYLSGETVEERWRRELQYVKDTRASRAKKFKEEQNALIPRPEDTSDSLESDKDTSKLNALVAKIRQWIKGTD